MEVNRVGFHYKLLDRSRNQKFFCWGFLKCVVGTTRGFPKKCEGNLRYSCLIFSMGENKGFDFRHLKFGNHSIDGTYGNFAGEKYVIN